MRVVPYSTDHFGFDGRGPEICRFIHDRDALKKGAFPERRPPPGNIIGVEYFWFERPDAAWVIFKKGQVIQVVPEEVCSYWFANQDQETTYRIRVIFLDANQRPKKEIFANEAVYADGEWSIRNGREIVLDGETLMAKSAKKIDGLIKELSFDPRGSQKSDLRLRKLGKVFVFSPDTGSDFHSNASMFLVNESSHEITYFFAQRVNFITENGKKSLVMEQGAMLMSDIKTGAPVMGTFERMPIPIPDSQPDH
jgi:hypothetical protein